MPTPCTFKCLRTGQRTLHSLFSPQKRNYNVAVLGGGITGLTAAWRLTHDPECSSITLYEKSSRLGGWIESEIIPVDNKSVVFEYGPRTLRGGSSAISMLAMVPCAHYSMLYCYLWEYTDALESPLH